MRGIRKRIFLFSYYFLLKAFSKKILRFNQKFSMFFFENAEKTKNKTIAATIRKKISTYSNSVGSSIGMLWFYGNLS